MHFHLITLCPDAVDAYLSESVLGRAREDGTIRVSYYNPREYTKDKHRTTDEKPYGGGPGMVMMAEPILRAANAAIGRKKDVTVLITSARGTQFDNTYAANLASAYRHVVIIAGRYEGVDQRVIDALGAREVTIGPYVLTGGEIPAMTIVDATARHVPGVLGNEQSLEEKRTASDVVYTRPDTVRWRGKHYEVPPVLLSGDHAAIERWRAGERGNDV